MSEEAAAVAAAPGLPVVLADGEEQANILASEGLICRGS